MQPKQQVHLRLSGNMSVSSRSGGGSTYRILAECEWIVVSHRIPTELDENKPILAEELGEGSQNINILLVSWQTENG